MTRYVVDVDLIGSTTTEVVEAPTTEAATALVSVMRPEQAKAHDKKALQAAALGLAQLIQKQRHNIDLGTRLHSQEVRKAGAIAGAADTLATSVRLQEAIRTASATSACATGRPSTGSSSPSMWTPWGWPGWTAPRSLDWTDCRWRSQARGRSGGSSRTARAAIGRARWTSTRCMARCRQRSRTR